MPDNAQDQAQIKQAISSYAEGRLVAIPTETVYGLSAPYNDEKLVKRIFELKKRPLFDPLIIHVSNLSQTKSLTTGWSEICDHLAKTFWPGPLTMVLPKTEGVSDLVTSGLPTVGLRMPKHDLTLGFIEQLGTPLVAPSANIFSKTSPTQVSHVQESFSSEDVYVLDGGNCQVGIESTIISVKDKCLTILRPGMIGVDDFQKCLAKFEGVEVKAYEGKEILTAGQIENHYMPDLPLVLVKEAIAEDQLKQIIEAKLGRKIEKTKTIDLSADAVIAARQLYGHLRNSAKLDVDCLIFFEQDYHSSESWTGIMDRLSKASSFKVSDL
jgi:L-threonylcarbamoyladenylate synthase